VLFLVVQADLRGIITKLFPKEDYVVFKF
jgi:rhodanese-related sulfurtransferase